MFGSLYKEQGSFCFYIIKKVFCTPIFPTNYVTSDFDVLWYCLRSSRRIRLRGQWRVSSVIWPGFRIVVILTRLRSGPSGVRIRAWAADVVTSPNCRNRISSPPSLLLQWVAGAWGWPLTSKAARRWRRNRNALLVFLYLPSCHGQEQLWIFYSMIEKTSRYSSHATGWQPWNRASVPRRDKRFISSPKRPYRLCCPPSSLFIAHMGLILRGIKRPQRETDLSPHVMLKLRMNSITPWLPLMSPHCVRRETFIVYVSAPI